MKYIAFSILITLLSLGGFSQTGNIGIGTSNPNASAILDVTSTTKGFLPPRMTTTQRDAISAGMTTLQMQAIQGLTIFNTTSGCLETFIGTNAVQSKNWQPMGCGCTSAPAIPGAITGLSTVCQGDNGIVYYVGAVTGATTYTWTVPTNSSIIAGTGTSSITVNYAGNASSGSITVTAGNVCGTSSSASLSVTVNTLPDITVQPSASTICQGANTSFSVTATGSGITYQWQVNSGNITNGGVYSNATTPTLNITGATAAMDGYTYQCVVTGTCSPADISNAVTLTVNPLPTISGTLTACIGSTTQLSGSATAAASNPWVSASTGVATVNSSGLVTGVSAGTSVITYTNTNGCQQTATVTVNPLPTISGTLSACVGSTTQLTGSATAAASNPWVSATTSVATVNSTGLVTAVAAGTSVITYTNTNGCQKTATVTVNALPTISGTLSVCAGLTTQLTGSATAAASTPWVSGTTGVATVNSSGLVTGVSAGTSVITYTNTNACQKTATVTVNALPTITGTLSVAACSTTQLTGSATAAASSPWVSGTTSLATVNSTGLVSGVTMGTSVITYTNTNGCQKTATVTVTAPPIAIDVVATQSPGVTTSVLSLTTAQAGEIIIVPWYEYVGANTHNVSLAIKLNGSTITPTVTTHLQYFNSGQIDAVGHSSFVTTTAGTYTITITDGGLPANYTNAYINNAVAFKSSCSSVALTSSNFSTFYYYSINSYTAGVGNTYSSTPDVVPAGSQLIAEYFENSGNTLAGTVGWSSNLTTSISSRYAQGGSFPLYIDGSIAYGLIGTAGVQTVTATDTRSSTTNGMLFLWVQP